jgi:hypothetical protein
MGGSRGRTVCCVLSLAAAGTPAQANGAGHQRLWVQAGAYHPAIETTMKLDSSRGVSGTQLNLEQDLGLSDSTTDPWLLIGGRLGDRWRLEFEYFTLDREAGLALSRSIRFGDTTYPIASALKTQFDSMIYRFSVGYSVMRTPDAEAGVTLGAHVTDFTVRLAGEAATAGVAPVTLDETEHQTVPLPTIGVYGSYTITPAWTLSGRVDVFKIAVGDYDGRLVDFDVSVAYHFTRNFALGAGYRYDSYRLGAMKSDFHGTFHYKFRGPQVFLQVGL